VLQREGLKDPARYLHRQARQPHRVAKDADQEPRALRPGRGLNVSLLLQDISQREAARSQERQKYGHLPSAPFLSRPRARQSGPRMVPGRSPVTTVMPNPQHDAQGADGDPSDEHAHADPVVMAGGDPAGAVGGRADREDEHGAGEEVPDRELAEPHAFAPLPAAPFNWDVLAAGITLATGIVLPFVYPPLRRGIANSPLLKAGASALLSSRAASDQ